MTEEKIKEIMTILIEKNYEIVEEYTHDFKEIMIVLTNFSYQVLRTSVPYLEEEIKNKLYSDIKSNIFEKR